MGYRRVRGFPTNSPSGALSVPGAIAVNAATEADVARDCRWSLGVAGTALALAYDLGRAPGNWSRGSLGAVSRLGRSRAPDGGDGLLARAVAVLAIVVATLGVWRHVDANYGTPVDHHAAVAAEEEPSRGGHHHGRGRADGHHHDEETPESAAADSHPETTSAT